MNFASSRSVRLETLAPWLLAGLVFAVAAWAAEPYPVGIFHDDGVYATLAKALSNGDGYRYLNLPGAPVATHYPPIYPLLLAIPWKLSSGFPANIPMLQLVNVFALALTAWGAAAYARRVLGWSPPAAMACALLGTLTYPLLGLSVHLLSEPVFAAALFPALILAERAIASNRSDDAWIAGAVSGLLTLVRTHGIALAGALIILLLVRRNWRFAGAVAGGALMVIGPWQLFLAAHESEITGVLRGKYAGYLPWLVEGLRGGPAFVGATVMANLREVQALLADRFSLSDHVLPRLITGTVAAVVGTAGAIRIWRRAPVTALFVALYIGILLLWPYTPWRFLYALWPIVIICFGGTIEGLLEVRPRTAPPALAGLLVAVTLMAGVLRSEHRAYRERAWTQPAKRATQSLAPVIRWVAANTAPADVVVVEAEQVVYLFTGRRAVPPQAFTAAEYVYATGPAATTESLRRVLSEYPATFVVTSVAQVYESALVLADSSRAASAHLVPLDSFPSGGAFRVARGNHLTSQP